MNRLFFLTAAIALMACEDTNPVAASQFAGPAGLVLAGSGHNLLFVANSAEDAIRVVDVSRGVTRNRFLESPSVFNPLRIPIGPNPTELAVSDDGRVIAVLDPIGGVLRLVDADAQRVVRNGAGDVYTFALGPAGSLPVSLEPDPDASRCLAPCLGRFFVSLSGLGQLVSLSFQETSDGFRMALDEVYETGGRPQRMAASPDGAFLFAIDAASDEVIRVDRTSGAVERRPIGAPGSDLAVSGDASVLMVARPVFRDVLIFDDIANAWSVRPAYSRAAPSFDCVSPCSDESVCEGAHPANTSVCSADEFTRLEASSQPYDALYLGVIPRRIEALSVSRGQPPLSLRCEDDDLETEDNKSISEYAVVIGEDNFGQASSIRWISVREPDGTLLPRIAENGFCEEPEVVVESVAFTLPDGQPVELDDFLDPCPDIPLGSDLEPQARFQCLRYTALDDDPNAPTPDAEKSGLLMLPGVRPGFSPWRLDWEPALDGLRRVQGGGRLDQTPEGFVPGEVLTDVDLDLAASRIEIGDIVRVLSSPDLSDPDCNAALDTGAACELERRVLGFADDGLVLGPSALDPANTTPEALPVTCFGAQLSYEVRAGDSFTVGRPGNPQAGRVRIGELFGPGGRAGQRDGVVFRIRDDLEARSELDACERYPEDGESPLSPQLRRTTEDQSGTFFFSIDDPTLFQLPGRIERGSPDLRSGQGVVPAGTHVAIAPRDENTEDTYMFVSYEASDTVLIFRPAAPGAVEELDYDLID